MPTIGGLGVLNDEDETDFEYQELGDASLVFYSYIKVVLEAMITHLLDNPNTPQQEASIEPMIENEFVPRKQDIVNVVIGDDFAFYEITEIAGTVNIPPFTQKYIFAAKR